MTLIKINAITVPEEAGDELARRFAARAGAVDGQDGFEGFELLRPTDGRRQWLVVTRWRDQESFEAGPTRRRSPTATPARRPSPHGGPVSVGSELWSYEVAGGSDSILGSRRLNFGLLNPAAGTPGRLNPRRGQPSPGRPPQRHLGVTETG